MTRQDVEQAKQALEQEGRHPSYDAVLAQIGHGSKRDVARFMRELAGSGGSPTAVLDPVPAPPLPVPPLVVDASPRAAAGPIPELMAWRRAYRHAVAVAQASPLYSPERRAVAVLEYDFHQRCLGVRQCLRRVRKRSPQGPSADARRRDMAAVAAFVGAAEATRLAGNAETPQWSLQLQG